jgi:5-(carboxyamino)imidazole ribonucleotide mutase
MVSALTIVPVLAVPVKSRTLNGVDSLLSIVQMPAGIPTATFAIGDAGATNAGLFAVSLLGNEDSDVAQKLTDYRESLRQKVEASELPDV